MTIKAGEKMPTGTFKRMTKEGPKDLSSEELFKGKKVVLFAVPGAFTPTCSAKHLPGFKQLSTEIKAKGVDTIACISVNDAFVMGAWGRDQKTGGKVRMMADGSADFAKATGLTFDLTARRGRVGLRALRRATSRKRALPPRRLPNCVTGCQIARGRR